ncbi:hypothetical protein DL768_008160 [Monosporascus sp. mg162]|nr:hypothetical protein DL768_008160 [Monosporascus sp. mg162]
MVYTGSTSWRERPELDYRDPRNGLRMAKSDVYRFGGRCRAGDPSGNSTTIATQGVTGDLLLRELGLRIKSCRGCVQLIRGHEPWHPTTKRTGRWSVVVNATHEGVRRWARRQTGGDDVPESITTADADLEGIVPEHRAIEDGRDRIPERYFSESDSEYSNSSAEESEASMAIYSSADQTGA